MNETLGTYPRTMSGAMASATGSLASAAGLTACESQDCRTTVRCGQEAVPVLCSQSQAEKRSAGHAKVQTLCRMLDELATSYAANAIINGLPTPGTYGRKCGDLSARDALDTFLENRLRVATAKLGSPLFELRWKYSDMTLGPQVLTLRASVRRTSGKDCFSWGTPNTMDHLKSVNWEERKKKGGCSNVRDQAAMTPALAGSGPTPSGLPVATEKEGQLKPEHSRWLMGYPKEWDDFVPTEMRLSRRSRRNSSARSCRPQPSQSPIVQPRLTFTSLPASGAA